VDALKTMVIILFVTFKHAINISHISGNHGQVFFQTWSKEDRENPEKIERLKRDFGIE